MHDLGAETMRRLLTALFLLLLTAHLGGANPASDTLWEVQPASGSDLNGGCYSATIGGGGSVDYPSTNTVILSLTNLTTSGAGATTITTVTASSFTSAMAGNCIRMNSGTNFQVGWYQITTVT